MKRKRTLEDKTLSSFTSKINTFSPKDLEMFPASYFGTCEGNLSKCCVFGKSYSVDCSTPGFPLLHCLLEFAQTHIYWVSDAIQSSHPLLPPSPALNLFQHQGLFQWVSSSHRWPKYWSFSFIISPSNEYSGLISFRMDWLGLLAVQGTLKSVLQPHSSKASINSSVLSLLCSPTLTSIHDNWKNHGFDYTDLCQRSDSWF